MGHGREGERRVGVVAALVLVGCFLGASATKPFAFPGAGAAILFPSYAIVTAALLRTASRRWWLVLLMASLGDVTAHCLGGAQLRFALLAEVVNHARALLAALTLRRLMGERARVETVRELAAFLVCAVFLAPAVAGLGGAWLVVSHRGTSFWPAWQQWSFSNAITGLTLLPLFVLDLRPSRGKHRVRKLRILELVVFVIAFSAVGVWVFTTPYDRPSAHPPHLFWALPFLLWAAVRFGTRGITTALLVVVSFSIWGALERQGPFARSSPVDDLLELQMFLVAASIPFLALAVLLQQQRRTAAALEESRRRYQSVVDDQTEMICRFLPDGTYTFVNRAYGEAFGFAPEELIGRSVWDRLPGESVPLYRAELDALTPLSPATTLDIWITAGTAGLRWQTWLVRGFYDEHGVANEYQAVGRDITERKRAEDEHRELESRRSVEVALREADRRKDEFLAVLGHELRNPLAPIGMAVGVLRTAQPRSTEAIKARESISRQLTHMTRIVDELLDISRITHGKLQLRLEVLDLGRVIVDAVDSTQGFVDSFGHALSVKLPGDGPVLVRGDGVRLTQVVANLLNNSAKYTARGGHIDVTVYRDGARVRLHVRDDGIGLEPDARERIFQPFEQVTAEPERAHGGLGIGLALVKRLVELHGGTVEARSEGTGRGTEIAIELPAVLRDAAPQPSTAMREPEATESLRILAVDDNIDIVEGLASFLSQRGHTVRVAHDGLAALEVATSFAPEVIVMDLGLPNLDGLEVARRLRQADGHAPRLLIAMSGRGNAEARRSSDDAGFHHHLVKPFDLDAIRALIEGDARARRD